MKTTITNILTRRVTRLMTMAVLLTAIVSGCANDDSLSPLPEEEQQMTLQFTITAQRLNDRSRALLLPSGTEQIGSPAENIIDTEHITFLLFDGSKRLITLFYPTVAPENSDEEKNHLRYIVTAKLPSNIFDYATGDNVDFYIMALANLQGNSPSRFNYPMESDQDISLMFDTKSVITFAAPLQKHIPMSGLQLFTVSRTALAASSPDNPLKLYQDIANPKDINMLRAIAKIEIIDKIGYDATSTPTQKPEGERISVISAKLAGYFSQGSILPEISNWERSGSFETQYVTGASIPSNAKYNTPVSFDAMTNQGKLDPKTSLDFAYDEYATTLRTDGCKVYSAYIPEFDPTKILSTNEKPWILVTLRIPADQTGDIDSDKLNPNYEIKLAEYTSGKPGEPLTILRNNIYRYEITGASSSLNLNWTVCDWDKPDDIDIPSFN